MTLPEPPRLSDVLEEGKQQGRSSGGGFKPELWPKALEALLPLREKGRVKTAVDVRNHYRSLKGMWKEAKELVDLSRFGWDEDRKKVTAEEEVWNDLIKV
ncbi:hypothetical protein A4X09_0g7666 [Tilletia walkeri]|uniref:Myb/SANT-like domain-containing protein n=1 Tax=Tilletia walkeri TaxID=117179 RepID=A0A8X7N314_9BASI|nr:hypothetical protein A4X09_0g7666 [Tilletia walkeri]